MGEPVYKSFGFQEIGRMTVQVEGDLETLDFPVMLRAPRTKAARDEKMGCGVHTVAKVCTISG